MREDMEIDPQLVSTHSRLKAAGRNKQTEVRRHYSFNTQPPEGGWLLTHYAFHLLICFNTQPPEGGWADEIRRICHYLVSTHSRLKAAGFCPCLPALRQRCFNTQPPEGGWSQPSV